MEIPGPFETVEQFNAWRRSEMLKRIDAALEVLRENLIIRLGEDDALCQCFVDANDPDAFSLFFE